MHFFNKTLNEKKKFSKKEKGGKKKGSEVKSKNSKFSYNMTEC